MFTGLGAVDYSASMRAYDGAFMAPDVIATLRMAFYICLAVWNVTTSIAARRRLHKEQVMTECCSGDIACVELLAHSATITLAKARSKLYDIPLVAVQLFVVRLWWTKHVLFTRSTMIAAPCQDCAVLLIHVSG